MNKNKKKRNPFPGLRSFYISEYKLYFGREQHINEVILNLIKNNFIAILGSTGSGKSSLAKAGVIPQIINNNEYSGNWDYCIFNPGDEPIESLGRAIIEHFANKDIKGKYSKKEFEKRCYEDANTLFEQLDSYYTNNNKLILYIDQFEELFRFQGNDEKNRLNAALFVQTLLNLFKNQNIYTIISIRSDYLNYCADYKGLVERINLGHYLVPKMDIDEIKKAIIGPIELHGLKISNELVDTIIEDTKGMKEQLPIVQHLMMRLWDYIYKTETIEKELNIEHYQAIGTTSEAISFHAEEIYLNLPTDRERQLSEKIFKALVNIEGDTNRIRRPTRLDELCRITNSTEKEVINIVETFRAEGCSFLMPPPDNNALNVDSIIDITRESITTIWRRYITWIEEEENAAQLYIRLSRSAELYQSGKTGLWKNPELQLALNWHKNNNPNANWSSRYNPYFDRTIQFLNYSKKENDRQIALKEAKQKRELRRARFFAIFLGTASLISIILVYFALNLKFTADDNAENALVKEKQSLKSKLEAEIEKKKAVSQRKIALQQQQIAEQQKKIIEEQKDIALTEKEKAIIARKDAEEKKRIADSLRIVAVNAEIEVREQRDKADSLKNVALLNARIARENADRANKLSLKATAKSIAIQSVNVFAQNKKEAKRKKLKDEKEIKLKNEKEELPKALALQAYHFNKLAKGNPYEPEIFNAISIVTEDRDTVQSTNGEQNHFDAIWDVKLSNDGKNIITCSDDATIRIWSLKDIENNTSNPKILYYFTNQSVSIRTVNFSSDLNTIIAGSSTGTLMFWKEGKYTKEPDTLNITNSPTKNIFKTSNSNEFLAIFSNGLICNINVVDRKKISEINLGNNIANAVLSADKSKIAIVFRNKLIKIYNSNNLNQAIKTMETKGILSTACFGEENILYIGTENGYLEKWNYKTEENIFSESAHMTKITKLYFKETTNQIISSSYDNDIKIWDANNIKYEPITIDIHDHWVLNFDLNKDETKLFTAGADMKSYFFTIDQKLLSNKLKKQVKNPISNLYWNMYIGNGFSKKEYSYEINTNN